jgi:hypothetical protein
MSAIIPAGPYGSHVLMSIGYGRSVSISNRIEPWIRWNRDSCKGAGGSAVIGLAWTTNSRPSLSRHDRQRAQRVVGQQPCCDAAWLVFDATAGSAHNGQLTPTQ